MRDFLPVARQSAGPCVRVRSVFCHIMQSRDTQPTGPQCVAHRFRTWSNTQRCACCSWIPTVFDVVLRSVRCLLCQSCPTLSESVKPLTSTCCGGSSVGRALVTLRHTEREVPAILASLNPASIPSMNIHAAKDVPLLSEDDP